MPAQINAYAAAVRSALESSQSGFAVKNLHDSAKWLRGATEPPVATVIEEAIDSLRNKQPEYEPLLFDIYINEASAAIDRCLSLRREIQELEASATSYARQYERFKKTLVLNRQLDETAAQALQATAMSQGFLRSVDQFPPDTLGPALRMQAAAVAAAHQAASEELSRKGKLLLDRWQVLDTLTSEEMKQHETPGHVLNFKERRDRYLELLKRDLREAWKKCVAVKAGLQLTFGDGSVSALPDATDRNALDELLFWTRDTVDFLERLREREVEFDLTVPLIQPAKDRQDADFSVGKNATEFKAGTVIFDLTTWLSRVFGEIGGKTRMASLRVKSIGASISIPDRSAVAVRSLCYPLVVFPPTVNRSLDVTLVPWAVRPPVLLNARPSSAGEGIGVEMESGLNIRNNPVAGEWRVRFLPPVVNTGATAVLVKNASFVDFKLHLRLVGRPLNDAASW